MSGTLININLDGLSEPATALIKAVEKAIGGAFRPSQIVRVARAESEAERIRAVSNFEVSENEKMVLMRMLSEEVVRQKNLEEIVYKASGLLNDDSKPDSIDSDWMVAYLNKCRFISDKEMQEAWSRILAEEANSPGTFSKRSIAMLDSMDKNDAEMFTKLCAYNWDFLGPQPLVFNKDADIYLRNDINFELLTHLDSIGLITFNNLQGYRHTDITKEFVVTYDSNSFLVDSQEVPLGNVLFTSTGRELSQICSPDCVDGFVEYIVDLYSKKGIVFKEV